MSGCERSSIRAEIFEIFISVSLEKTQKYEDGDTIEEFLAKVPGSLEMIERAWNEEVNTGKRERGKRNEMKEPVYMYRVLLYIDDHYAHSTGILWFHCLPPLNDYAHFHINARACELYSKTTSF